VWRSALPALPAPAALPVGDSETPSLKPVDFDIDPETKSQIDMAVELGEKANPEEHAASFQACFALISLRDSEDLSDLSPSEREYFAKRWYSHLRNLDRINPTKPPMHYYTDISSSVRNAKRDDSLKLQRAWTLAQSGVSATRSQQVRGRRKQHNGSSRSAGRCTS